MNKFISSQGKPCRASKSCITSLYLKIWFLYKDIIFASRGWASKYYGKFNYLHSHMKLTPPTVSLTISFHLSNKALFQWYWWGKCCCFTCLMDPDLVERPCSARQGGFTYSISACFNYWCLRKNSSAWKVLYIAHDTGDLVTNILPFECGNPSQ